MQGLMHACLYVAALSVRAREFVFVTPTVCVYLQAMYNRPDEFGGSLFSLAVSVMTDLIHHEPQSFRQLNEAGLPDAFLASIKVRAPHASRMASAHDNEAWCCCLCTHIQCTFQA
jgi:hypothetical protein